MSHKQLEFHPLSELFPLLEGAEFDALVNDVRTNGLRQLIVVDSDEKILDGRNRYRACLKAKVKPVTRHYNQAVDGPLVPFVISLNLHRRHLSESQRAMVAAKLANMKRGDNQHASIDATSQSQAAELLNVSRGSVQRAGDVLDQAARELVDLVERGRVAVSTAADVSELSQEEQREIVARGEKEILQAAKKIRSERLEARRAERMTTLAEVARSNAPLDLPSRFPIVYADPPWRYEHVETESRAIENQYPTMDLDSICAMPLARVTTDDAVLFLWATSPKLDEAMRVVREWGFTYRTCMVWVKDKIGMGYYARQQHELLLIAAKGNPPMPAPSDRPSSVVMADRDEHSAKPVVFYELIERMYPQLPRVELFARNQREGWTGWGNQATDTEAAS